MAGISKISNKILNGGSGANAGGIVTTGASGTAGALANPDAAGGAGIAGVNGSPVPTIAAPPTLPTPDLGAVNVPALQPQAQAPSLDMLQAERMKKIAAMQATASGRSSTILTKRARTRTPSLLDNSAGSPAYSGSVLGQ